MSDRRRRAGAARPPAVAVRTAAVLGAAAVLVALGGCESSQEKSAKLERVAKLAVRRAPKALTIEHPSKRVRVSSTAIIADSEGTAVVVTLHNSSAVAERGLPIALTVRDAARASVYTNTTPGISHLLTSVPLVPAHGTFVWIDDQVPVPGGRAKSVTAVVGEGTPSPGAAPSISVRGARVAEGSGGEATVVNHSGTEQRELVVFATAVRGGRVAAAGRAVVPQLAGHGSAPVQLFFVGNPAGAQLRLSAPASTFP